MAESLGLEPRHRFTDYWPLSKRLPYQLGLRLQIPIHRANIHAMGLVLLVVGSNEKLVLGSRFELQSPRLFASKYLTFERPQHLFGGRGWI